MKSLVALSIFAVASLSSANLVVNGGFEDGLNGWTPVFAPDKVLNTTQAYAGASALKLLSGTNPDQSYSFGIIEQDIADVAVADLTDFSYYTINADDSPNLDAGVAVTVIFDDFSGVTIYNTSSSEWQQQSVLTELQADYSDKIIDRFQLFETWAGDYNVAVDNVSIEAVPEPASMAVLGLGLAAVAKRRRR
jgi:hypothetical protein